MKGVQDVYITEKGGWNEDRNSLPGHEHAFLRGKI